MVDDVLVVEIFEAHDGAAENESDAFLVKRSRGFLHVVLGVDEIKNVSSLSILHGQKVGTIVLESVGKLSDEGRSRFCHDLFFHFDVFLEVTFLDLSLIELLDGIHLSVDLLSCPFVITGHHMTIRSHSYLLHYFEIIYGRFVFSW